MFFSSSSSTLLMTRLRPLLRWSSTQSAPSPSPSSSPTALSFSSKFRARLLSKPQPKQKPTTVRTEMPNIEHLTPAQFRIRFVFYSVTFLGFGSWALYFAHGSQIENTPLFKGVMFTIRQDAKVRKYIGQDIQNDWRMWGWINHIKGRADLDFDIQGSEGKGHVHLEALRYMADWYVKKLVVTVAGEDIVHVEPHKQQPLSVQEEEMA